MMNPFTDSYASEPTDEQLVKLALGGQRSALDDLLRRHQRWLYNVVLRLLQNPEDAEDATQESLMKIVTRLSTFRGECAFRTWAYRIALRHVLDRKRSRPESVVESFHCYAGYLASAPDEEPPGADAPTAEERLLVEEAKLSCLMGMLLCLDRGQRLVFVLGELLEASDAIGSAVLDLSKENFRQKLSRARQQLSEFMHGHCGLMDPRNPCRCARKTRAFVRDGIVDPRRLVFARPHVSAVRDASARHAAAFEESVGATLTSLFRALPLVDPPDIVAKLRAAMEEDGFRSLLNIT